LELFPYRAGERNHEIGDYPGSAEAALAGQIFDGMAEPTTVAVRRSNWHVAAVVVGIMGTMAAIGLGYALVTVKDRRKNDHPTSTSQIVAVAPAKLAALAYLPGNSNVIAGLHIGELLDNPSTQDLLPRLQNLEQWTGLQMTDLDHVALGVRMVDQLRIILVVQTRQPYDPERVRVALQSTSRIERGPRTLYRVPLGQLPVQGLLWCAGERTLVFSLNPEGLDDVPHPPVPGTDRFSSGLEELLTERMKAGTPVWVVGQARDWGNLQTLLALVGLSVGPGGFTKEARAVLSQVRAFGTWLQVGADATWQLEIEAKDPTGARELEHYLLGHGLEPGKPLALFAHQPQAEPLAQELGQTLDWHQHERWVTVHAKASLGAVRQAVASGP
jgi:hypothetical protein